MGIMDKLQKNSRIKESSQLDKSKLFSNKDMVTTPVPMTVSYTHLTLPTNREV